MAQIQVLDSVTQCCHVTSGYIFKISEKICSHLGITDETPVQFHIKGSKVGWHTAKPTSLHEIYLKKAIREAEKLKLGQEIEVVVNLA